MNNRISHFFKIFKTPLELIAFLVSTGFGSGLIRPMPGTWGTFAALPLIYLLSLTSFFLQIFFWFLLFLLSTYFIFILQKKLTQKDLSEIVIDEILGISFIFLFIPFSINNFLIAFILFRFFDILKIPPVRQMDSLSKNSQNLLLQSSGVILDDLLAALQTLGTLWLIQKITPILTL